MRYNKAIGTFWVSMAFIHMKMKAPVILLTYIGDMIDRISNSDLAVVIGTFEQGNIAFL